MRERIDELVDALLDKLDLSGVPDTVCERLRAPLYHRFGEEDLRTFVAAHMDESPACTLDRLVLAYDPNQGLAQLTYKN